MPSKKGTAPAEETCYICRRSATEVAQFFQAELLAISKTTQGFVNELQGRVKEIRQHISMLESFQKKLKKDISWETAIREPEAMMEFIPGLKEVWPTLFSVEPEMKQAHTLSAQSRLTIEHLQKELDRATVALDKLKAAPKSDVAIHFSHHEVALAVPSYKLTESGDDVERIENRFGLKVVLCQICTSLLPHRAPAE